MSFCLQAAINSFKTRSLAKRYTFNYTESLKVRRTLDVPQISLFSESKVADFFLNFVIFAIIFL